MDHDSGARQEFDKVEARRAAHLAASCSVDRFGHTCDVHIATKRARELAAHSHGNSRGDTARAEVDHRTITIGAESTQLWHIAKETAVDCPLPRLRFQRGRARDEAAPHPLENGQGRGRGGHVHLSQ